MTEIIYPAHFRIVECRSGRWFVKHPQPFYDEQNRHQEDIQKAYGVSPQQLLVNLFRVNGGRSGFYLANLKQEKYYYCGQNWEDIRDQLLSLGIGRAEPIRRESDER